MSPTFERFAELDLDVCQDKQYRIKAKPQLERFTARPSRRTGGPPAFNGAHRRRKRHYFSW